MRNGNRAEDRDTFFTINTIRVGGTVYQKGGRPNGREHRVVAISVIEINEIIGAARTGEGEIKMAVRPVRRQRGVLRMLRNEARERGLLLPGEFLNFEGAIGPGLGERSSIRERLILIGWRRSGLKTRGT